MPRGSCTRRIFPPPPPPQRKILHLCRRLVRCAVSASGFASRAAGCIVAAQSDNETCYLFHDHTTTDYLPILSTPPRPLRDHYTTLPALNAAHHAHYTSFDAVRPPPRP